MHSERGEIESDSKQLLTCTEEIVSEMMEKETELASNIFLTHLNYFN